MFSCKAQSNNCGLTCERCYCSEELRGIPRANNAKDVDWTKVANSIRIEASTKPSPVKISVSELLKQVKPPKQKADTTAVVNVVDPRGKFILFSS